MNDCNETDIDSRSFRNVHEYFVSLYFLVPSERDNEQTQRLL